MPIAKRNQEKIVEVMELHRGRVTFMLKGTTPLLYNAISAKVRKELLLPPKKKNRAEKENSLKHNPYEEFWDRAYIRRRKDNAETALYLPNEIFKGAICNAALEIPGATKSSIGRLSWVDGSKIDIYGLPKLHMAVVRQAGIQGAPDIRIRPIVEKWCCYLTVNFTKPNLSESAITNLVAAAGFIMGVGDFRPQKGKGNFGTFELVDTKDKEFKEIMKHGDYDAQIAAMKRAEPYDEETEELLSWFETEADNRGFKVVMHG